MKVLPTRSVPLIAIVFLAMSFGGCTTYMGKITLRPDSVSGASESETFSQDEIEMVRSITAAIALKYDLREEPGPFDPKYTAPYRIIASYNGNGRNKHVGIAALVKNDRSEILFVITDQVHGSETEIASQIHHETEHHISEKFPKHIAAFESSSRLRSLMAP